MSVFWGLAAIMIIIALLFTVPWLLRAGRSAKARPDPDALNTEIIKAQLAELDTDLKMGRLDENQYAAARRDLERELLDDLSPAGAAATTKPARSGQWVVVLLVVAIPLMAVALYQQLGSKQIIPLLEQSGAATADLRYSPAQHEMGEQSLEQMVNVLAARMKEKPDDLRGWILLARSYETLNRYADALGAYRNARRLSGDNPELLADYADALVMANGGRFNDEAGELLQKAVEAQPNNVKALWLIGHWKNQQGAYTEAISYWQRAAALLPAGSEDSTIIAQQISQVQQRSESPPPRRWRSQRRQPLPLPPQPAAAHRPPAMRSPSRWRWTRRWPLRPHPMTPCSFSRAPSRARACRSQSYVNRSRTFRSRSRWMIRSPCHPP